jgi:uncharacterized damage-inducible protein DinB
MISDLLQRAFVRNHRVVHAQADGLTHEQSLTQTEYNVNCFNWVLGHIVDSRTRLLDSFGYERVMPDEQGIRYRRESDPIIADNPDVISFEELLAMFDRTQQLLDEMLGDATEAWLEEETPVTEDRSESRLKQIHFVYFHDTYHTGQTDLLRQMSGFSDKII